MTAVDARYPQQEPARAAEDDVSRRMRAEIGRAAAAFGH
jgi:hypothetical protein